MFICSLCQTEFSCLITPQVLAQMALWICLNTFYWQYLAFFLLYVCAFAAWSGCCLWKEWGTCWTAAPQHDRSMTCSNFFTANRRSGCECVSRCECVSGCMCECAQTCESVSTVMRASTHVRVSAYARICRRMCQHVWARMHIWTHVCVHPR